jgi:hypothetical protein
MRLNLNALALLPVMLLMANTSSTLTGIRAPENSAVTSVLNKATAEITDHYSQWNLSVTGLSKQAFNYALKGYRYLLQKNMLGNTGVITIVDYSRPSSEKRLFVLDMNEGKILFQTLVAHGRNTGYIYAKDFSNAASSLKTSLGFYITANTYTGSNGYSLKLKGCEKGINDKAMERAIVMHGADYATENFLHHNGYLGRSHGCPAVPEKLSKEIIDVIKNGSCMFLYYPAKKYTRNSKILNSPA